MRIMLVLTLVLFLIGMFLFILRAILFFRAKNYSDEMAVSAFSTMRIGMVLVVAALSGMIAQKVKVGDFATINIIFVTGLISLLILLVFTSRISKWLSMVTVRNDLKKMRDRKISLMLKEKQKDRVPVVILEDMQGPEE